MERKMTLQSNAKPNSLPNRIAKKYLQRRKRTSVDSYHLDYPKFQINTLKSIYKKIRKTQYAQSHNLPKNIPETPKIYKEFTNTFPIVTYDDIKPRLEQAKAKANIIRPWQIPHFSASSWTTSAKKHIPVSKDMIQSMTKAWYDMLAMLATKYPEIDIVHTKSRPLWWSIQERWANNVYVWDISAIMIQEWPRYLKQKYAYDIKTLLLANRTEKKQTFLNKPTTDKPLLMAWVTSRQHTLLDNLRTQNPHAHSQVIHDMQVLIRWGVDIKPFRKNFQEQWIDRYIWVYNASEGYFAFQDITTNESNTAPYILLPNHGIFYEFIPFKPQNFDSTWKPLYPEQAIPREDIQPWQKYAIVITTNSWLVRYIIWDVIQFIDQTRFYIVWRTKQSLNLVWEELMETHTDHVIHQINSIYETNITQYTIWPNQEDNPTKHLRVIEIEEPHTKLGTRIDTLLREKNADYNAKREWWLLQEAEIVCVPIGSFHKRYEAYNKLWSQNKIPKIKNTTDVIDFFRK